MKAIIIDDERDSRDILSRYIKKYCPSIELTSVAENALEGLKAIKSDSPDIVFLDIEMPYANGFDLLNMVDEVNFEVVFVTAYDNYAIQALNQSAAYYILKPIDINELINAVEKIASEKEKESYIQHSKVLKENLNEVKSDLGKLMLPTMEGFELVNIKDIIYCLAQDNFTEFHFTNNKKMLICKSLGYFETILQSKMFFRIHRSHMINIEFVKKYTKGNGGFVTMINSIELEVSGSRKKPFLKMITA